MHISLSVCLSPVFHETDVVHQKTLCLSLQSLSTPCLSASLHLSLYRQDYDNIIVMLSVGLCIDTYVCKSTSRQRHPPLMSRSSLLIQLESVFISLQAYAYVLFRSFSGVRVLCVVYSLSPFHPLVLFSLISFPLSLSLCVCRIFGVFSVSVVCVRRVCGVAAD